MEKKCKIYLPSDWMYGDATAFYVDIIADGMREKGYVTSIIKNLEDINSEDVVVTVVSYNVKDVYNRHPRAIINWYQGIAPEEYLFFLRKKEDGLLYAIKKYLRMSRSDNYALKHCDWHFFVSETMLSFFRKKFLYRGKNNFIMPCFNQLLNKDAFKDEKYATPSFVYAGSMDGWQCFEKTVLIFKELKQHLPNATFTVLTAQQDVARQVLEKHRVEASMNYVPHDRVDEELRKFKYGFIIRDNNPVNRVATPTKMNSYMANGIIPVFTDVVGAFKQNLSSMKYSIPLTTHAEGLDKLYEIEKKGVKAQEVFEDFKALFDTYYSRERYIKEIAALEI